MDKMYANFNLFPLQMGMIIDAMKCKEKEVEEQKERHEISLSAAESDKYWIHQIIGQMEAGLEECGCTTENARIAERI